MNTQRRTILRVSAAAFLAARGRAFGAVSWNRQIRISVDPRAKEEVVALLTGISRTKGLGPTLAEPSLNELKGRTVVFFSFGRTRKEMLLTITDVLSNEELQIRAYYEPALPGVVESIVAELARRVPLVRGARILTDEANP
jgi:hypothetical protein